jgi:hypothetical protein
MERVSIHNEPVTKRGAECPALRVEKNHLKGFFVFCLFVCLFVFIRMSETISSAVRNLLSKLSQKRAQGQLYYIYKAFLN